MGIWRWKRDRGSPGIRLGGVDLGDHPWLVLGGGGLKGLAHLGVLRVLEESGFRPAGIVGTSIGGLVGARIAAGDGVEALLAEARTLSRSEVARLQRRTLLVRGVRAPSVFDGATFRSYLARVLPPGGWESLTVRFQVNAVELGTGRTEWFGIGARTDVPLPDAIYASAALPVFYPPARLPGGYYVDGGVEDALALRRAVELGATGIVAVDVGAGERTDPDRVVRMGLLAVHERIFSIMSGSRRRDTVEGWTAPPLLYLRPELDGYGTFDFDQVEAFVRLGEEAARAALATDGAPSLTGVPAP